MLLKPPPHTESISINGPQGSRRYAINAEDGLIHGALDEDLSQLLAAGCEAASDPPPKAVPSKVRLRAPRPHMAFAPDPAHSGVRYVASAEGFFEAREEHVKALLRAGCARI